MQCPYITSSYFAQQHFHSTQRRSVIYLPRPNNAGTLMRLDLVYFLALFVLLVPSVAKTHQSISHKFMAFGDKGVIGTVIGALQGANRHADNAANSVSNRLGEKLFGATAESEHRNAEVIAPAASHEPTTVGRRSKGPDGSDPFRASAGASASSDSTESKPDEPEQA